MIRKVEKLISVGKFASYSASGDVSLKKLSLIYGDNGSGKTTMAAVMRSLSQDRPEIIVKRESIATQGPQEVVIIERGPSGTDKRHSFSNGKWSSPFPEIEVFDIHFVNDNVYSGFTFSDDHKKQLHDFIIGAQGVAIKASIEENKAQKQASRQNQETLTTQIVEKVQNGLTSDLIGDFLAISSDLAGDYQARVLEAEAGLKNAQSSSVIQSLQSLSRLSQLSHTVDFETLCADMSASIQTIQDEALSEAFKTHCKDLAENGIKTPESWIKTGFDYISKKTTEKAHNVVCPFCGRILESDVALIRAYTVHFNSALNDLVARLNEQLRVLSGMKPEVHVNNIASQLSTNDERIASWTTYMAADVLKPKYTTTSPLRGMIDLFTNVISLVKEKCANPTIAVVPDAVRSVQTAIKQSNDAITDYNTAVDTYNNGIILLKSKIQTVEQAQTNLNALRRMQKRVDPAIMALCKDLSIERASLKTLEGAYPELIKQQDQAAKQFLTAYRDRINYYLNEVFKTPFQIQNIVHVAPRGKATQSRIDYQFTIGGKAISFDPNDKRSTKDCLSEGDKSTIAFAFFLSKQDIDPDKAKKIVIIDDPLSSFDSNRRANTVRIIQAMIPEFEQVVVLSHNEYFLKALHEGIEKSDKIVLRILEDFSTGYCIIEPLDLDSLVELDYFRYIRELEQFISRPDPANRERVVGLLRNVLESHIYFVFYRIARNIPATHKTFGRMIDELEKHNVSFKNDTYPPTIVSKLRMLNAVSWRPHHGDPRPSANGMVGSMALPSIPEIVGLISDTIDLIDNRL